MEASQYSTRKLLLHGLTDFCAENPAVVGPLTDIDTLWGILAAAEERDPTVTWDLLLYPTVGVWLTRILRRLHGQATGSIPVWSELGYLHSLVAVAAIRAGVPCHVRLPVVHGVVTLPAMGQLEPPMVFPAGFAELRHTASETTISIGRMDPMPLDSPHFRPAHRHVAQSRGVRMTVEINDCDPYREFSEPLPPQRLDSARSAEWRKLLDEAFDLLTLWHPDFAWELSAGLRMVTPLSSDGMIHGASSSVAIGCVAVAQKPSATLVAETLVHEFQHSKLNGLLGLFDLGQQDDMYAPWRDDPRPLSGLLHGVLAFLSVAEFWQVQRDLLSDEESKQANFTFALRRQQVGEAISALRNEPALTRLGRRLLESLRTRFALIERQPVSAAVAAAVTRITDDHRATWRIRHVRPDPDDIAQLANAWLAGVPLTTAPLSRVVESEWPTERSNRVALLQLKATAPETFAEVMRHSTLTPGDAAYLAGDHVTATAMYLTRLSNAPDDTAAWVGLGLALRARGIAAATAILTHPEVVIAVHSKITTLTGTAPDPLELVNWVGAGLVSSTDHSGRQ
nr:HEXXH motif domain-containing protein [Kibdelosporangium sp. MJ126-NF4]CEL17031.1 Transcriptional regulator [Kibdelosporangium sp. MJ126-NF4]